MTVTGLLEFRDCLLLDADILPIAVHISPIQPGHKATMIQGGYFILIWFGIRQAQISASACPNSKWLVVKEDGRESMDLEEEYKIDNCVDRTLNIEVGFGLLDLWEKGLLNFFTTCLLTNLFKEQPWLYQVCWKSNYRY